MKIRFGIKVSWVIMFFVSFLLGTIFPEPIGKYLSPLLSVGALIPFVATHYLSLTNQANPDDFSNLAVIFLTYAFFAVFYADNTQRFFTTCMAIFIAIGLEFYWPNWLFAFKNKLLALLKRK